MPLHYLAAPYTHPQISVREDRAQFAARIATRLTAMYGDAVYSPISLGHMMDTYLPPKLSTHKFWMKHCLPFLRVSKVVTVLPMRGWRESKGLQEELALAKVLHIPVQIYQNSDGMFGDLLEEVDENEAANNFWTILYDTNAQLAAKGFDHAD